MDKSSEERIINPRFKREKRGLAEGFVGGRERDWREGEEKDPRERDWKIPPGL